MQKTNGKKRGPIDVGRGTLESIRGEELYNEYLLSNYSPMLKLMDALGSRQIGRIDEGAKEKAFGKLLRAAEKSPERFMGKVMEMAGLKAYSNRISYFFETDYGAKIASVLGVEQEVLLGEIRKRKNGGQERTAGKMD